MASVFVKVSVNDELPKRQDYFLTNVGLVYFKGSFNTWVKWWLKKIELPSEEDVRYESLLSEQTHYESFINGSKFILDKLKGGNNG